VPDKKKKASPKTENKKMENSSQSLIYGIDELQDFHNYSPVGYLNLDQKGLLLAVNLTPALC
jgi:hypothetical protein